MFPNLRPIFIPWTIERPKQATFFFNLTVKSIIGFNPS